MKLRSLRVFIVAALALAFISPVSATAPDYSTTNSPYVEGTDAAASIFDPLDISEVRLEADETTIDTFRWCCDWGNEGPWQPGKLTMTVKGVTVGPLNVGWHLKGAWGSWRNIDDKAGFKIRVDAFVKNQTIFGVKKLILNNMVQEPASLNQQLTMRLFRAMGVPASRTGYAHMTLHNSTFNTDTDFGLYTMIESLDKVSLARWFETTAHLYKGGVPYHWADLIPEHADYLQVDTGSTTNRADLIPFLAANVSADWWTEINKYADMKEFTREWATELMVGHWDGQSINGNNFFLHVDKTGRFSLMPWGVDQTWSWVPDYRWANKLMSQKCMQTAPCYAMYLQAISDVSAAMKTIDLDGMAAKIAAVINPFVDAHPSRRYYDVNTLIGSQGATKSTVAYLSAMPYLEQYNFNNRPEVEWFDAALKTLTVAGSPIKLPVTEGDIAAINLAPGTKSVSVSGVPRATGATVTVTGATGLATGTNTLNVTVRSVNTQNTRTYVVPLIVPKPPLTRFTKTLTVSFNSNNTVTSGSIKTLAAYGAKLKTGKATKIAVVAFGSTSTRLTRLKYVNSALVGGGMPTALSLAHRSDKSIKSTQMSVVITYYAKASV